MSSFFPHHCKSAVTALCVYACVAFFASPAGASTILATSYNTPSATGDEGNPTYQLNQQFTLTSTVSITSIDLAVSFTYYTPMLASDLIASIVNDSSNNLGSTVLATDTQATGTLQVIPAYSDVNFLFNPVTLGPGTYWIALSDDLGATYPVFNWELQTAGTINPSEPGGYIDNRILFDQTMYTSETFMAQINGTLGDNSNGSGDSPEPGTFLTALGGIAGLRAIGRRRRESD